MFARSLLPLVLSSVALAPLSASAEEDRAKAKKEMEQGVAAYEQGNFIKAKMHFQKASDYAPSAAGPHRELGKACQELKQWNEAKSAYLTYLALKPEADDAAEIQGYISEVSAEIEKMEAATAGPGSLYLTVDVSGATIEVDGKVIGKSPLKTPYKLSAGEHTVTVSKRGLESYSEEVRVRAGEEVRVRAALGGEGGEEAPSSSKGTAIALLAVGGAGLAAGVVGGVGALGVQQQVDDIVDNNLPVEFADFDALVKKGQLFNIITIAGYGVAAVGGGVGAYFLLRGKGGADGTDGEESARAPALRLTPTARGALLTVTF